MKSKSLLFLSIIFLLFSLIAFHFLPKQTYDSNIGVLQILPERLRAFIAARLWEKADHLMHKGPVVTGQTFAAGSYAGNTDIIPYLKMVIALCPEETAPYRLLASNYAYHLGMKKEALELLERAFSNCVKSKHLHELYASAAFIHLFTLESIDSKNRKKDLEKAEKYINMAISSYNDSTNLPDPVFKLNNYYIVKARILWESDKPKQALEAWQMNSDNNLETSNDKLAKVLLNYKETGVYEPLRYLESANFDYYSVKPDSCEVCNTEKANNEQSHVHKHEHGLNQESVLKHEKSLLQALIWLSLKAGLVFFICIILWFRGSESYGTVSCAFRFSAGK